MEAAFESWIFVASCHLLGSIAVVGEFRNRGSAIIRSAIGIDEDFFRESTRGPQKSFGGFLARRDR